MGFKNFNEYWEARGSILEKLGVTKDVAKMIWNDACDAVHAMVIEKYS